MERRVSFLPTLAYVTFLARVNVNENWRTSALVPRSWPINRSTASPWTFEQKSRASNLDRLPFSRVFNFYLTIGLSKLFNYIPYFSFRYFRLSELKQSELSAYPWWSDDSSKILFLFRFIEKKRNIFEYFFHFFSKRKFHNSPASIKIGRWYLLVLLISVVQTLLLLHDEVINAATSRMLRLVYRERDEWVELYITFYITLNRNERNFRGANRLPSSPLPLHITERRKTRIEFSTWRLIKPAKRKIEAVPNIIAATGAFKVNNELGGENFIRRPYVVSRRGESFPPFSISYLGLHSLFPLSFICSIVFAIFTGWDRYSLRSKSENNGEMFLIIRVEFSFARAFYVYAFGVIFGVIVPYSNIRINVKMNFFEQTVCVKICRPFALRRGNMVVGKMENIFEYSYAF